MRGPLQIRGSFFRPNLALHAYKKGTDGTPRVREAVVRLVRARAGQSGIVYCLSRRTAESTAEFLRDHGIRAQAYHAGLEPATRTRVQDAFRRDDVDVVVATVAFGMGIDKPNIRYVIHRDMPRSVESYYQEIGRAGRDGVRSDCVLFYSWTDVMSYDRFSDDGPDTVAERNRQMVRDMFDFADRTGCRHQAVVAHFGERIAPCGGSCDYCLAPSDIVADAPAPAKRRRGARPDPAASADDPASAPPPGEDAKDESLFLSLKGLRKRLADARGVPAYMVFSDATLIALARERPHDEAAMLADSGIGPKKLALYGEPFLQAIREWQERVV
jgi:ATP-dependent DNA helicase RecQ